MSLHVVPLLPHLGVHQPDLLKLLHRSLGHLEELRERDQGGVAAVQRAGGADVGPMEEQLPVSHRIPPSLLRIPSPTAGRPCGQWCALALVQNLVDQHAADATALLPQGSPRAHSKTTVETVTGEGCTASFVFHRVLVPNVAACRVLVLGLVGLIRVRKRSNPDGVPRPACRVLGRGLPHARRTRRRDDRVAFAKWSPADRTRCPHPASVSW
mmetsp:Transcript_5071/g.12500  ORF Transcript_5071/g.12500 Transcript_5071/m.12500 type:complete len:212 (+) Transcript_5071:298-933(+)